MPVFSPPKLERLRYWQGQMLRSRDFNDQEASAAQMRWSHNHAVHGAFGVSVGLVVSAVAHAEPLNAVSVSTGLAYDSRGREIVGREEREVELPAAQPESDVSFYLVIRLREPAGRRQPVRAPVEYVWKHCSEFSSSDGVPIARVQYTHGHPELIEKFVPRLARAVAKPKIASGCTIPGQTTWERLGDPVHAWLFGIQARVDTSAAGFPETPCYFASMHGPRWDEQRQLAFAAPFTDIAAQSPTGFIFQIWLPIVTGLAREANAATSLTFARRQGLYICWLGSEPSRLPPELPERVRKSECGVVC